MRGESKAPLLNGESRRGPSAGVLLLMCGVSFSGNALIGLVLPFLPRELDALKPTFAPVDVLNSVIMAAFPLAMLMSSPLANVLVSHYGRYALLKWGLVAEGLATLIFPTAPVKPDMAVLACALFVGARLLQGVGASGANLAVFAIVADEAHSSLATVMGLNEVVIGLAFTSAPVIGCVLYDLGGFMLPFAVFASFVFIMAAFVVWHEGVVARAAAGEARGHAAEAPSGATLTVRTETGAPEDADGELGSLARLRAVCSRELVFAAIGLSLATAAFGMGNGILGVHLHRLGMGSAEVGAAFGVLASSYSIISPIVGCVVDRCMESSGACGVSYQEVMTFGVVVSGLCAGAMALPKYLELGMDGRQEWIYLMAVLAVMGLGQACALIPSLPAMKHGASVSSDDDGPGETDTDSVVALFNIFMCAPPRPRPRPRGSVLPVRLAHHCVPQARRLGPGARGGRRALVHARVQRG